MNVLLQCDRLSTIVLNEYGVCPMPNKLKSRTSSNRRPQALCEPAPKKRTVGSKAQLRATALLAIDMRFIPASDFESLEGDSKPVDVAVDLM